MSVWETTGAVKSKTVGICFLMALDSVFILVLFADEILYFSWDIIVWKSSSRPETKSSFIENTVVPTL